MDDITLHSDTNTITRGFVGGGSSRASQRRYTQHVLATNVISLGFPMELLGKVEVHITFSKEDAIEVHPHDNDPLVITVRHVKWDIKRVLVDPDSFTDVLF